MYVSSEHEISPTTSLQEDEAPELPALRPEGNISLLTSKHNLRVLPTGRLDKVIPLPTINGAGEHEGRRKARAAVGGHLGPAGVQTEGLEDRGVDGGGHCEEVSCVRVNE